MQLYAFWPCSLTRHSCYHLQVEPLAFSPVAVPEGHHRLQSQYCLWYSRRSPGKQSHNFDQNLKLIGRFGTCEQFWSVYSHLVKPGDLASHSDFHLFKMGIKPMWEDEANKFGGKWIVRLRKGSPVSSSPPLITCDVRSGLALLGEPRPRFARGTIHGWGGDLWRRGVDQVPGGHPQHLEQDRLRRPRHGEDQGHLQASP